MFECAGPTVCTTSTFASFDQDLRHIYALDRHEGILTVLAHRRSASGLVIPELRLPLTISRDGTLPGQLY
jgi:hypothetical protein